MSRGLTAETTVSPHRWKLPLGAATIVLAALAAYHNSLAVPFLFDDHFSIEDSLTIRHLWPIWKVLSPSATSPVGGRPIMNLSLALNYALGGTSAWGYHAFNLAVHVLAALTLYGVLRPTLLRRGLQQHVGAAAEWVALTAALIWTVHPLQTEAVTYISQRCESLMGLFYLLTLYAFIRGVESRRSGGWFTLSVAACFLGMGSKEVMVTAPVMVLLYDRTFVSGSFRDAWIRHRHLYLLLASSWLFLGVLMTGLGERGAGYGPGSTWWGYAMTECAVILHYCRLALWPHPLVFDYGEYVPMRHLAATAPYALILAALVIAVLFEFNHRPALSFVGAWFFVILAPTSSVVPIVGSPMAEHRMYLPLAAIITLTVIGAVALGNRLLNKQPRIVLGCVAGASVVALFTSLTIHRNRDYLSELGIWQDSADKCPNNPRAHTSLGLHLMGRDRLPEAIAQFELALQIQPGYVEALNNLGLALVQLNRLPEAISYYEQVLRFKPDNAQVHYNLAVALERAGRQQEAVRQYELALQIKPNYAEPHINLGVDLMGQGKTQEAIARYEHALRINPDFVDAHYNLGIALMSQGRVPEAIGHYERALRFKPDFAEAHNNLGNALLRVGKVPEAIAHYEQALRLKADYAEAHNNLGLALAQLDRLPEATEHWQQALRIKPDYADPHFNLGVAL